MSLRYKNTIHLYRLQYISQPLWSSHQSVLDVIASNCCHGCQPLCWGSPRYGEKWWHTSTVKMLNTHSNAHSQWQTHKPWAATHICDTHKHSECSPKPYVTPLIWEGFKVDSLSSSSCPGLKNLDIQFSQDMRKAFVNWVARKWLLLSHPIGGFALAFESIGVFGCHSVVLPLSCSRCQKTPLCFPSLPVCGLF